MRKIRIPCVFAAATWFCFCTTVTADETLVVREIQELETATAIFPSSFQQFSPGLPTVQNKLDPSPTPAIGCGAIRV